MRRATFFSWIYSWSVSFPPPEHTSTVVQPLSTVKPIHIEKSAPYSSPINPLDEGINQFLLLADASTKFSDKPDRAPSKAEIQLLRAAFAEFYGVSRDLEKSVDLLTQALEAWESTKQNADEVAGLYRVRGDGWMLLLQPEKAYSDYDSATRLLESPIGQANADPAELPAALLGRARAAKSLLAASRSSGSESRIDTQRAAQDYERAIKLTSREDWDTDEELLEDGATRNPYAAWEWGSTLGFAGKWSEAARAHNLASQSFAEIGDKARSVISLLDAGIDLAAAGKSKEAAITLTNAVQQTKGVEGRDVALLQKVIAKEGEGRMALAALLWDDGQKADAERVLGDACIRLEQLQVDAMQRNQKNGQALTETPGLRFSIDDGVPVRDMSCYKFRNPAFLTKQLGWPVQLQEKVMRLETLR